MPRRRPDRAQVIRARKIWWERNGTFLRGFAVGVGVSLLSVWMLAAAKLLTLHGRVIP